MHVQQHFCVHLCQCGYQNSSGQLTVQVRVGPSWNKCYRMRIEFKPVSSAEMQPESPRSTSDRPPAVHVVTEETLLAASTHPDPEESNRPHRWCNTRTSPRLQVIKKDERTYQERMIQSQPPFSRIPRQ